MDESADKQADLGSKPDGYHSPPKDNIGNDEHKDIEIDEIDEFQDEHPASNISSPLPSFPNKQSNIKHNTIFINRLSDASDPVDGQTPQFAPENAEKENTYFFRKDVGLTDKNEKQTGVNDGKRRSKDRNIELIPVPEEVRNDDDHQPTISQIKNKDNDHFQVKSPDSIKHGAEEDNRPSDLATRFFDFFSLRKDEPEKSAESGPIPPYNNDEPVEITYQSDSIFDPIDNETRAECIKMLKYYNPSSSRPKVDKKLEVALPPLIELDSPIPEELSLDYNMAKYNIQDSIIMPEGVSEEYKEVTLHYQTLS